VLLLLLGVCAVASQATTLAVDPKRTVPGGRVTVTATNVPANQVGEIQLLSSVHTYTFRANSGGEISQEIVVPADIELGNHIVRICWDRSCHKQTPLRVVSGVALAEPTPAANASASPSASPSGGLSPNPGSTPTARPSPTPTSTPRSTPTSTPKTSPKPAPSPTPSPTPTSNPCPTPNSGASLTVSPSTIIAGVTLVTVTGQNFIPGRAVTSNYYLGSTLKRSWTGTVSCAGTFSWSFTPGPLDIGSAKVTATDGSRSANKSFNILA
jgi:hypothetical protein